MAREGVDEVKEVAEARPGKTKDAIVRILDVPPSTRKATRGFSRGVA